MAVSRYISMRQCNAIATPACDHLSHACDRCRTPRAAPALDRDANEDGPSLTGRRGMGQEDGRRYPDWVGETMSSRFIRR
jgi:hypothetical protein